MSPVAVPSDIPKGSRHIIAQRKHGLHVRRCLAAASARLFVSLAVWTRVLRLVSLRRNTFAKRLIVNTARVQGAAMAQDRSVWRLGVLGVAFKLLLAASSHSTDLEVHRHWMALTSSLPMKLWYTDASSKWTLDYPPLFAYFERFLAMLAAVVVKPLINIENHNYSNASGVYFMRWSVLATDIALVLALNYLIHVLVPSRDPAGVGSPEPKDQCDRQKHRAVKWNGNAMVTAMVLFHPGLVMVDNMHFQYNGLLLAVLLLSIAFFIEKRLCAGAVAYSALLNMKHTFLPTVPVIAAYILIVVFSLEQRKSRESITRLARVASATVSTFLVIWTPLIARGGRQAVLDAVARMFPFDRGLFHALWAPNIWALYAWVDILAVYAGLRTRERDIKATTGIIGAFRPFGFLPNPSPVFTAVLVALACVPAVGALVRDRARLNSNATVGQDHMYRSVFLRAVACSCLGAFMFGWHVHEKMILLTSVPLCAFARFDESNAAEYVRFACFILNVAGAYGIFPLLRNPQEALVRLLLLASHTIISYKTLFHLGKHVKTGHGDSSRRLAIQCYLLLICLAEIYAGTGFVHRAIFGSQTFEFLPLMVVSGVSAVGVLFGYALLLFALTIPT